MPPRPTAFPTSVLDAIASRQGTITAALYDQETGQSWVLNPGDIEDTASIVKLEIMAKELVDQQRKGKPLDALQLELTSAMIEASDNDAATALWNSDGGPSAIAALDKRLRLHNTSPSTVALIPGTSLPGWGLTTTSALDQIKVVRAFVDRNAILDSSSRAYGLSLMTHVEQGQNWGVSGGIPAGVSVALKNGWLPLSAGWQVNSVGWIDGDGRNYILAVLTNGNPDEEYGIDTIQALSSASFAALDSP